MPINVCTTHLMLSGVHREVNIQVICIHNYVQFFYQHLLSTECESASVIQAMCNSSKAIVIRKGDNAMWTCGLRAPPASHLSVVHNTTSLSSMELTGEDSTETLCDNEPRVFYQVEEDREHECYSSFTVRVVVCAAEEGVQGDYSIEWGDQNIAEGSTVSIDLSPPRPTPPDDIGAV